VADYPLQLKPAYKKVPDGGGGWVEIPGALSCLAIAAAEGKTSDVRSTGSSQNHICSSGWRTIPRISATVLHLTDGESSDGDPTDTGQEIMSLKTADGSVLLLTAHLVTPRFKIEYPADEVTLRDRFARTLFQISSVLPNTFLAAAAQLGSRPARGSRGFVFNGDPSSIVHSTR